jgi:hypothetical protein
MRMTLTGAGVALSVGFLGLAGCGAGGGTSVGGFEQRVIGPGGGEAEAQNVRLVVPPGAFTEDHVVSIFDQPVPLPIEVQPDGATILYHDNIMCIGPLDLALLVDGYVRMCYPPSGYPKGLGEEDLVLLEWNESLGVMQVAWDAVQNLATHCFEDFSYDRLGHVAVGVRFPPPDPDEYDFAFYTAPEQTEVVTQGDPTPVPHGITVVDLDGQLPVLVVPDTTDGTDYLGNGDGSRVLYQRVNPFEESSELRSFDVPSLTDRLLAANGSYLPFSPAFGWFGSTDTVYRTELVATAQGVTPVPSDAFGSMPGGGGGFTPLFPYPSNYSLEDVRISPDGSMALLRFFVFDQPFSRELVAVVDALGNVLSSDLPCDIDFGEETPRFLPDSSGITFLDDDGVTAKRIDPDGTDVATIYTSTEPNSFLQDFAVAPVFAGQPQRCAFLRFDFGLVSEAGGESFPRQVFATDELGGGDLRETVLDDTYQVVELVHLFSDGWATPLVGVQLSFGDFLFDVSSQGRIGTKLPPFFGSRTIFFSLTDATIWKEIPSPLAWIDFARGPEGHAGEALLAVPSVDTESFPEYPTAGIYHLDELLQNPVLVTPEGYRMAGPPRWLESWRRSPGFSPFEGVR